jgi:DNA-binding SARP family transcriptional activator
MIGYEDLIRVQDRKLSLNPELCWVDVWAAENLFESIEAPWAKASRNGTNALALQQQMMSLYTGDFLGDDNGFPCILTYRQRMRSRFLDRLGALGIYWEKRRNWDQAIHTYGEFLELDDRQERIYQRLIACYRKQGLMAEAMAVYERCREALSSYYGISPSAETQALYNGLRP